MLTSGVGARLRRAESRPGVARDRAWEALPRSGGTVGTGFCYFVASCCSCLKTFMICLAKYDDVYRILARWIKHRIVLIRYTQFASYDSRLFGPNPWKVLALIV